MKLQTAVMKNISVLFLFFFSFCRGNPHTEEFADEQQNIAHRNKEVVAFVYHRFGESRYPSTNIDLSLFEEHLAYLKIRGFHVMTFGEAVDYLNDPSIEYVERAACITVDDGYKSFITGAWPILQNYGFKATVFINSESVGGGSYMDWEELKKIHEFGTEIGNHSHSHAYFVNIPEEQRIPEFVADVRICQEAIKKHLGFYPDIFAYPYGEYDPEMKAALQEMGFKGAAAQNSGVMYLCDNYAYARFPMAGPYAKLDGFKEKSNMKALRIICSEKESDILTGINPPKLTVEVDSCGADLTRVNCYTAGECEISVQGNIITVQAKQALKARRTRYTITAPGKKDNTWYWYSHLWVIPEVSE
jgi:peptidoglycan/xylan/chitin deacetylase (PgdA/CDA1 family)